MRSSADRDALHPDKIKLLRRNSLYLQAQFNRFLNPGHQLVKERA